MGAAGARASGLERHAFRLASGLFARGPCVKSSAAVLKFCGCSPHLPGPRGPQRLGAFGAVGGIGRQRCACCALSPWRSFQAPASASFSTRATKLTLPMCSGHRPTDFSTREASVRTGELSQESTMKRELPLFWDCLRRRCLLQDILQNLLQPGQTRPMKVNARANILIFGVVRSSLYSTS